jgi:4,5-dihydroxyphthalate decarboxylase
VFPSRHFRLSCIFVAEGAGIDEPADLAGRRVGLPVFDMAAAVWLRGILHDLHGLDRFAPTYVTGGPEGPREGDEHPQYLPPAFKVERRSDAGLAQLLAAGEIDALYTARAPSTWPGPGVRRLFADPRGVELDYHRASGIFPAMHVLAVKRAVAEEHPGLPAALYRAFAEAQALARADLFDSAALDTILPWQLEELLDTERLLGPGHWASGLAANRRMLDQVIAYSRADGLVTADLTPEDLFAGPGATSILAT